jgi:hypothetical protein
MFIKIGEYTINTDNITFADIDDAGRTIIFFGASLHRINVSKDEAESLWTLLNRVEIKPKES